MPVLFVSVTTSGITKLGAGVGPGPRFLMFRTVRNFRSHGVLAFTRHYSSLNLQTQLLKMLEIIHFGARSLHTRLLSVQS